MELPPRARRIPQRASSCQALRGTTSACAENTTGGPGRTKFRRNYLRVRGEYIAVGSRLRRVGELPPRARRILFYLHGFMHNGGTTSACAENTCCGCGDRFGVRNYLRVRGEYQRGSPSRYPHQELPPRARRIHPPTNQAGGLFGTTSACAENTRGSLPLPLLPRNYLRVRGEYAPWMRGLLSPRELPPRARRIRHTRGQEGNQRGTTSACAENTPSLY